MICSTVSLILSSEAATRPAFSAVRIEHGRRGPPILCRGSGNVLEWKGQADPGLYRHRGGKETGWRDSEAGVGTGVQRLGQCLALTALHRRRRSLPRTASPATTSRQKRYLELQSKPSSNCATRWMPRRGAV